MKCLENVLFAFLFLCFGSGVALAAAPDLADLEGEWFSANFLIQEGQRGYVDSENPTVDDEGRIQTHPNGPFAPFLQKNEGQLVVSGRMQLAMPGAELIWRDEPEGILAFVLSSTMERMEGETVTTESHFYHLPSSEKLPDEWAGLWTNKSHEASGPFLRESLRMDAAGNVGSFPGKSLGGSLHPVAPEHLLVRRGQQAALVSYEWEEPNLRFELLEWYGYAQDEPEESVIVLRQLDERESERERVRQNLLWLRGATRQYLLDYGLVKVDINDLLVDYRGLVSKQFQPGPEKYGIVRGEDSLELFQSDEEGRFPAESFYLWDDMEYLHAEGDFKGSPLRIENSSR
ncbi:MAG: hypothetical protein JJT75_03060 [Opitutales bacterium]|nr:hypothetical protein [Opitutales bacterium]MCH8541829.1 hypothetical protein [Opitutales bacterium]